MKKNAEYVLIFISWNSACLTLKAVRSAYAAVKDRSLLRIIIVDNGSTDGSPEIFAKELPETEIIGLEDNLGFAAAVNAGLEKTGEQRIAFILNTDLEFSDDIFSELAMHLAADPAAVLASPKLLRPDGSIQAAAVPEPSLFWELTNRSLPRRFLKLSDTQPAVVPSLVGPCMAVHLPRLRQIGFMDRRFFFFFEETDLCRRINQAGKHVLYVPTVSVTHLQGETANRRPYRARIQFYRSRYQYFYKHYGILKMAALACGIWLKVSINLLLQMLLTIITAGFCRRCRDRLAVYAVLWVWHIKGCPPHWGFEKR